jgi:hypothetical protein
VSLIKRFMDDADELSERAANAAWLDSPDERLRALTVVFEECGVRANVYADPMFAARTLVKGAVSAFRTERTESIWDKEFHGV